jgi:hypothetical protein
MGAVAAFQAKWFAVCKCFASSVILPGSSSNMSLAGGTGFVLFLLVLALILSLILIIVPIIYDRSVELSPHAHSDVYKI